jgi:hypothetical protein
MAGSRRRPIVAITLALVGGAAIVAGCFLAWIDVGASVSVGTTSISGTPKGTELLLGQVSLGAGIATLVFALLLLLLGRGRRLLGSLILIAGLAAVAAAGYVAASFEDRYAEFTADQAAAAGQTAEVRASVSNLFESSALQADAGIGLYLVIGGGIVGIVAGLAGLFGRRKHVEGDAEPTEPESMKEVDEADLDARAQPATEGITPSSPTELTSEHDVRAEASAGMQDDEPGPNRDASGEPRPVEGQSAESDEPSETPKRSTLGDEWHF